MGSRVRRHGVVVACLLTLLSVAVLCLPVLVARATPRAQGTDPPRPCPTPALAALRPPDPPRQNLPPQTYDPLRGNDPEIDLGVGHVYSTTDHAADWPDRIRLPLFAEAGGSRSGWMVDGWILPDDGSPTPLGARGLVEVGYEIPSFIVLGHRDDGWTEIRYGARAADRGWTHECLFEQAAGRLAVERWEARFLSGEISPLYFRRPVAHALRAAPDASAPRLRWLPADDRAYAVRPVEVRGDWMRVEVSQPSDYCADPDAPPARRDAGWLRWRDEARGPWLWYHTRGC